MFILLGYLKYANKPTESPEHRFESMTRHSVWLKRDPKGI